MLLWKPVTLALAVLAADQLSKWAAGAYLAPGESLSLVGNLLRITLVHNPGAAFGLLPEHTTLLLALATAAAVGIGWMLVRGRWRMTSWVGLALLWAGTVGNLVDRYRWGHVVDFLQVPHWPVFNVADSALVVGALLIAWHLVRRKC